MATAKIYCKVGDSKRKSVKSKIKDGTVVQIIQEVDKVSTVIAEGVVTIATTPPPPPPPVCPPGQHLENGVCVPDTPPPPPTGDLDKFGIKKLHQSIGREWFSKWDNGHARSWVSEGIDQRNADPDDPESDLHANTKGSKCIVDGRGKMIMEGENPRLYINKDEAKWQNVEMTLGFKAIKAFPTDGSSVFIRLAARSEHQKEYNCASSGHTMGSFEIKANKTVQLRKELVHPAYADNIIASMKGPDRGVRWLCKFVLRNSGSGILSQAYVDTTGKGDNFTKVLEKFDTGNWPMSDSADLDIFKNAKDGTGVCKKIASPTSILLEPATSCYLRADGNVVEYDSFSIREIAPA